MRKLVRLCLAAALAGGFAALLLPTSAAARDPLTIRFGFANIGADNRPFAYGSAAALAHAERYLEEEFKAEPEIRVQFFFFKGAGPAVNEGIANGQLDFAYQGDLPAIIGRASGLKTKLLLASGAHAPIYLAVPAGSEIKSVKDLKGRKVAIFRGTNNHLAAVKVLAANGLTERDLQVLNMDNATTNAALASRDIDAAFGNYPLIAQAQQGLAKIVYSTKGDNPAFERHAHALVTEAFEAAHPDIVARVVKTLVRAAHWSSEEGNRERLLHVWARSGIPAEVFRYDFEDQPLKYRNSPLIDAFLIEQYAFQARQAKEYGLVRRDVDMRGWFEPRYLEAALKELGLETYWTRYDANGKPSGS